MLLLGFYCSYTAQWKSTHGNWQTRKGYNREENRFSTIPMLFEGLKKKERNPLNSIFKHTISQTRNDTPKNTQMLNMKNAGEYQKRLFSMNSVVVYELYSTRSLRTYRCTCTHPLIGDTNYSGVAADHQKDEAEQRHVPSAKHRHRHTFSVRLLIDFLC